MAEHAAAQNRMDTIKTKTFEVAVYRKGDPSSSKLTIVTPGRLDTKDYVHNTSLVDELASLGYFALAYDPPGTWESPGGTDLYTTTNCLKVIDELIEHFGNKDTVLIGHSRGGSISMLGGMRNPHVTRFIPIFSYHGAPQSPDPDELVNGVKVSYRDLPPGKVRTKERKKFELPLSYFKDGEQYNALPGLRECNKPKLFFYGTKDVLIEPDDVREAFDASAEPKQIHEIDSEHDYRLSPSAVDEVNRTIAEFLS